MAVESLAAASQLDHALAAELAEIVGADGVISRASELAVYECDGWTIAKSAPDLLVLPRTTAHVSLVLAALERRGVAFVPRGAGTGLSGGCLPLNAPVMICTSRMNRILACDLANRRVEVESGVINLNVTNAVKAAGYFYAPDPSSQAACTIGGNIAENSGGPHTLKYGVTANHVLGVELVLAGGEVVELGGPADERLGYDLFGRGDRRRGHRWNRHARNAETIARAPGASYAARDFRRRRERDFRSHRNYRRRDHTGRDRNDGPAHHSRG
jgi:glycolate oxidase